MKLSLSSILKTSLFIISSIFASGNALAQVTTDNTVNTQVNQNGNVAEITGGETRGDNLFHSFGDFSVPTGNEAFFNNADNISNIFSRVTGGNISNIDGALRANGSANLFLINPAGIIFGNNARLDIGGSFYGSTASSILFEDGEFSAVDNLNEPILTVNAPIGLGFRDNPGDIVNRSTAPSSIFEGDVAGLEVSPGNALALIGGNINFEAGNATARSGNIRLGGLSQAGTVSIDQKGSLSFPTNLAKSNITLTDAAKVDVEGIGRGNIAINAQNLSLEASNLGLSAIRSGILATSTSAEAQAGDITINVAENITLDNSLIINAVAPGGTGNSGNININTGSITVKNGGSIDASTFGQGNAGTVDITATDNITFDGEDLGGFPSGATSRVDANAVGNAGGVTISTTNLTLTNGGRVDASTLGQGNAGTVDITATGTIAFDGENSEGSPSGAISVVNTGAAGDAGGVTISTTNLTLTNGGRVSANVSGKGNAGAVDITATGDIGIDGETSGSLFNSGVTSGVDTDAEGDAGSITISTNNLTLTNGGRVGANTLGKGNAGVVDITVAGDITFDGEDSQGFPSGATSLVDLEAVGDAGGVTIEASNLTLTNGGRVDATTFGQGNAGAVDITATSDINFDGETSQGFTSGATSTVSPDAVGNAGGVTIKASNLTLTNGGQVSATALGQGNAGNVDVKANSIDLRDRGLIDVVTLSETGVGGTINLQVADDITLRDGGLISAEAFDDANGGNLNIDTNFIIAFPNGNNDIIANAQQGQGGNVNINAEALFGIKESPLSDATNDINASSEFSLDGIVNIFIPDVNPVQGATKLSTNVVVPEKTTAQTCQANRETAAKNGLNITGKGGIIPAPDLPLNAQNIIDSQNNNSASTILQTLETKVGKIQPAKGIKVTESGEVILTAYRTSNSGERFLEIDRNCGI